MLVPLWRQFPLSRGNWGREGGSYRAKSANLRFETPWFNTFHRLPGTSRKVSYYQFQTECGNFIKYAFCASEQNTHEKAKVMGLRKYLSERSRWTCMKRLVMGLCKYLSERSRWMCMKRLSSWSSSSLYECRLGGTLPMQKEYKRSGIPWFTVVGPRNEVWFSVAYLKQQTIFPNSPLFNYTSHFSWWPDKQKYSTQPFHCYFFCSNSAINTLGSLGRAVIAVTSSGLLYKFHLYKMYYS